MRQIAIVALALAVLAPVGLSAQAREPKEVGPILRERVQPAPAQQVDDPGPQDY